MNITIDSVNKSFIHNGEAVPVLKDITFDVKVGEIVTLLGRSGTGKSTILNIIAGLEKPTSGKVHNPLKTGYIFQDPAVFPWLTIRENILIALNKRSSLSEEARLDTCIRLLKVVGLSNKTDNYPSQLSGGERQRASIAQTIALDSHLILMDEPFSSLDAFTRWEMNQLILNLAKKEKLTIIFVTHSIEEAVYLSDRILILSTSPAQVHKEISLTFSEERDSQIIFSPQFTRYTKKISETITNLS